MMNRPRFKKKNLKREMPKRIFWRPSWGNRTLLHNSSFLLGGKSGHFKKTGKRIWEWQSKRTGYSMRRALLGCVGNTHWLLSSLIYLNLHSRLILAKKINLNAEISNVSSGILKFFDICFQRWLIYRPDLILDVARFTLLFIMTISIVHSDRVVPFLLSFFL